MDNILNIVLLFIIIWTLLELLLFLGVFIFSCIWEPCPNTCMIYRGCRWWINNRLEAYHKMKQESQGYTCAV